MTQRPSHGGVAGSGAIGTADNFLFSRTIRDNITLGYEHADDDVVDRALQMAAAYDFVTARTDGLATRVGERGVLLSGGQKQRLC